MLKLGSIVPLGIVALFASAAFIQPAPKASQAPRSGHWAVSFQNAFPQHDSAEARQTEQSSAQGKPDYSQEPFVIEQFHTRVRFENDGTGRRELQVRIRVQSEAGVHLLGQLVFPYNSANERLEIDSVEVRKADGVRTSAAAAAVQDLTAPVAREAPVYTDTRQKHVTVPGLRPGETLAYHLTWHLHMPLALGQFWLEHDFLKDVIVLDEQLEVNVPRDRAIKLKTQPGADPAMTEEGDRRIYRWKNSNLKRGAEEEAKPKKKPTSTPVAPAIQLTAFQSWEEVGRWYAGLERERVLASAAIRTHAEELARGRSIEIEKIEALYDFVAKNFRYVSLSFGVGRYQPHAASEVLANGYGDCKDKHTLLAALVEAIGLRAYPVLIHSTRKIDPEVPSPAQFDHLITVVPLGQEWIWLDTTTEVAPFRLLSANLRHKQALVIPMSSVEALSGDAARLMETPTDPPFPATQRVDVEGQVSELGKLTARVRYTMRGDTELLLRVAFRRTPRNQWKQIGQLLALAEGYRGEVSEVKAGDPAATRDPFQVEYLVTQANYLDWSSKRSQLTLPLPALGLPEAESESEGAAEPVELGAPLDIAMRVQLELPAKYAARAPVAVAVMRDYAEYRSSYKVEGNKITAEHNMRFWLRELPAARARDYVAFTRAVRSDEGQTVTIESTAVGTPTIPASAKADELYQAGMAAFDNNDYRTAVELLKRVVELEPRHESAWNNLGRAYLELQQEAPAIEAFRKQIEVNPYDEYAYNNLGRALWRQQKYDEAAAAFHKQIEINPLDRRAHANLGSLYSEQRKFTEAIPELEQAATLAPDDPILPVQLGRAYLETGQREQGLAAFEKAIKSSPSPGTWNNVAYYLAQHKLQLDRAQQYAESAVATMAALLRNAALERLRLEDVSAVAGLASFWDTLGWVFFAQGNLDRAEKYIEAAWQLTQHGEVGDHLGQIYEKRGRPQDAARQYALALAASRPVPETRKRLAALLGNEKQVDERVNAVREELVQQRIVKLGKLLKASANAEFFVLFAPGSASAAGVSTKVEDLKFVSGDEQLRPLAAALRSARYPVLFPDDTPTRLVRRGVLSCSALTSECVFVLYPADAVQSVN